MSATMHACRGIDRVSCWLEHRLGLVVDTATQIKEREHGAYLLGMIAEWSGQTGPSTPPRLSTASSSRSPRWPTSTALGARLRRG